MKDIPKEIKDLYQRDNRYEDTPKSVRLRFYDGDVDLLYPSDGLYPSEDLFPVDDTPFLTIDVDRGTQESLELEQVLCDGKALIVGDCNASMVSVIVADVEEDLTGREFVLTIECGGYEMMIGVYQVDSFVKQADVSLKKIEAYDRMRRFQVDVADWYQGLTFPLTLKQFRDSLCSYVGIIQQNTTLPLDELLITKTVDPQQMYGLDVIQAVCEINGCFGQMDEIGKFKYVFLGQSGLYPSEELFPSDELFPAEMEGEHLSLYNPSETTYEDYLVGGIDRVKIRQEEGDVGGMYPPDKGGKNVYIIQGNFLTYGKPTDMLEYIASVVYDNISGRVYRPCKIVAPALPWVEPGDGVICYTSDDVIETYCLKRTIKGIQGMMDTFEASGTQEIEQDFGIATQIIQLEGKSAVIKKSVEEVSVKVSNLKEYTEAQIKILADNITLEVTRAKDAEAKLSASIRIQAGQIAMKVSKGDVSSQLSIESGQVYIGSDRFRCETRDLTVNDDGADFSGRIRCGKNGDTYNFIVEKDGSGSAAAGKFTWSNAGNLKLVGAELSGCLNTGTMGADVIHCNSLNANYIECNGDSSFAGLASFIDLGAARINCYSIYSELAGDTWSDKRLKKAIKDVSEEDVEKLVLGLRAVTYKTKKSGTKSIGFVAQHVKKLQKDIGTDFPLLGRMDNGYLTIKYQNFIPIYAVEIQRLYSELHELKKYVYESMRCGIYIDNPS